MLINSVRDNENNRWERKAKEHAESKKGMTQAIVKVRELDDFVVRFS